MKIIKSTMIILLTTSLIVSPTTAFAEPSQEEVLTEEKQLDSNKKMITTSSTSEQETHSAVTQSTEATYNDWFPDDQLAAIIAKSQAHLPTDVVTESQLAGITSISCVDGNVSDLSGIENLPNLTSLYCARNNLTTIDTSHNPKLTDIECSDNQLTSINVSQNTNLTKLDCSGNELTTIDVDQNPELTSFDCGDNQLSNIDVSQNLKLTTLNVCSNELTSIDISQNSKLTSVYCNNNLLSALDVSCNPALTLIDCEFNQLSSIDTSKNLALATFQCDANQLSALDISHNTNLKKLQVANNQLTTLDCSSNKYLQTLWISNNQLTTINFSNNKNLIELRCSNNHIQDFTTVPDTIKTFDGSHQSITLPAETLSIAEFTLPVSENLKDIYGKPMAISFDSTQQYYYPTFDSSTGVISWRNLHDTGTLSYTYSGPKSTSGTFYIPYSMVSIHLSCVDKITYNMTDDISEQEFLQDIQAETEEENTLTSDFETAVDFSTPQDYQVTVTATDPTSKASVDKNVTVQIVSQAPEIQADKETSYAAGEKVTEAEFLEQIHAKTDDGTKVTSDFEDKVDMSKPDDYRVTLHAENQYGQAADPVEVIVHVTSQAPEIQADTEISYIEGEAISEAEFLEQIHAKTDDGTEVTSDFVEVVDFSKSGNYRVTLNAENQYEQKAEPIKVDVHVTTKAGSPDPDTPSSKESDRARAAASTVSPDLKVTDPQSIDAEKTLPKTGDDGIYGWIILGSLLTLSSFYMLRRKK
ncbi:LapB repeat-containing protein [Listeria ilorinensis]|uniref:LapB repeat-containing protein n=1 Tax=Listeria ilorinensis TaxID=2867439 RepID=UPI001EF73355|nr:LapB repeat-containing protein [Listeria ilorinensis]